MIPDHRLLWIRDHLKQTFKFFSQNTHALTFGLKRRGTGSHTFAYVQCEHSDEFYNEQV